MHTRVSITPVGPDEIQRYRLMFCFGWIFCLGILPWILMWDFGYWATFQLLGYAVPRLVVLVFLSAVSVLLGWFLGYRYLWGPLFMSKLYIHKP